MFVRIPHHIHSARLSHVRFHAMQSQCSPPSLRGHPVRSASEIGDVRIRFVEIEVSEADRTPSPDPERTVRA